MKTAEEVSVDLAGKAVAVAIRRNRQAKRLILRIDGRRENAVVLTLPYGASVSEGLAMVHRKAGWILPRLEKTFEQISFADGAAIPFLGVDHVIRHHPETRGTVWREEGIINVAGKSEHLSRRVSDWLRKEARTLLSERARFHASVLGTEVKRVTVRDTRSRWGSCSAKGGLSFSWRLVLAPEPVLDYVAAHEAAHLVEMNHGEAYWHLVGKLVPDYQVHRKWLKRHGAALHHYG